jgi:hypothetical protein
MSAPSSFPTLQFTKKNKVRGGGLVSQRSSDSPTISVNILSSTKSQSEYNNNNLRMKKLVSDYSKPIITERTCNENREKQSQYLACKAFFGTGELPNPRINHEIGSIPLRKKWFPKVGRPF